MEFEGCTSLYGAEAGPTTVPAVSGDDQTSTTVVSGPITLWAQPITIQYRSADLALYTTSSSAPSTASSQQTGTSSPTSGSTTSGTGVATSANTSPTATTSSANTSQGLSGGAIAGIAIGCAAIVGILIGAAIFFRQRQHRHTPIPTEPTAYDDAKPPIGTAPAPYDEHYAKYTDGSAPSELPSGQSRWDHMYQEAPGSVAAHELPVHAKDPRAAAVEMG